MPLAQGSKLLFCLDEPRHTGAHLFVLGLRDFLLEQGCEVSIISDAPYPLKNCYRTPTCATSWKKLLSEVKPDLGIGVLGRTMEFALALRSHAIARTWMCLVCPWLWYAEGERARQANLLVYDDIIVPSHASALALSPPAEVNIRRLGQGINTQRFQRSAAADVALLKRQLAIRHDDFVLGYAGRFCAHKNQLGLVAGLLELVREEGKQGQRYQLILCGPPPTDQEREYARGLLQKARQCNLSNRVHVHFVEHTQLPLWYSSFDLMISLSATETFGLSTIEALACGTPLVALDTPAFRDSLDFYPRKWLPPYAHIVWEKVRKASKQREQLRDLGHWAAKTVREKRELRTSLEQYAEYFSELITGTALMKRAARRDATVDGVGTRPMAPLA
jgi:glycosyltransferase involved in cell wall biosynthesis